MASFRPIKSKPVYPNTAAFENRNVLGRSQEGCYTCRLRRKKCDEVSPCCIACDTLGLHSNYEKPIWWSNIDQREAQRKSITMHIKRKKPTKKTPQVTRPSADTLPELPHPLPTASTFSGSIDRKRSASISSQFPDHIITTQMQSSHLQLAPPLSSGCEPRQTLISDGLTWRQSTIPTYGTYHAPPNAMLPSFSVGGSTFIVHMGLPDFSHSPIVAPRQVAIELDENDQLLLDHFIKFVVPFMFPILEINKPRSAPNDVIIPALENNKHYLQCCLSISAQYCKTTMTVQGEQTLNDIMHHRYTINGNEGYQQMLEVRLFMIFSRCLVSQIDDSLDFPWQQHFNSAVSLVHMLELPRLVTDPDEQGSSTPFTMTLMAWIDILSAAIHCRAPIFANAYRKKYLSSSNCSLGLRELMGCEDKVMYLISEIAYLRALKLSGMNDTKLCHCIDLLSGQIGLTEVGETGPKASHNLGGMLNPDQLSKNITTTFRLAARVYLCSLLPGFSPSQDTCVRLVSKLASALEFIPSGPDGFDRSLAWVYLIGGSFSTLLSPFRTLFNDRITRLGHLAETGSLGRVSCLLREVWSHLDTRIAPSELDVLGNVMQRKGWNFLLM